MKKIESLLKISMSLCVLWAWMFSSCSDSNTEGISNTPRTYYYRMVIPNADDVQTMVIDSISSDIAEVSNTPSWLSVAQNGSQDGHPVIEITTKMNANDAVNDAKVLITFEDGNSVELSVRQSYLYRGGNNAADDFLTNWESMEKVCIGINKLSGSTYDTIWANTPWNREFISTSIPMDVARNVKKSDGWEMVFSTLGETSLNDANYFALYNKYLGLLRIFYYITDATGSGSEVSFAVTMGSPSKTTTKQPFYNMLGYSIPTSHDQIITHSNITGSNSSTFFTYAAPYTISGIGGSTLTKGWGAIDIDMSAYPKDKDLFLNSGEAISIECSTISDAKISLGGTLTSDIKGSYSSAISNQASSSGGLGSALSSLGGLLGDVRNSALAGIEQALTGSKVNTAFYYAGVICNTASFIYDYVMDELNDGKSLSEEAIDSMPGKIQLTTAGKIDLNGYIRSRVQNNVSPLSVTTNVLKANGSHIGQGVWSLAEDPVVYVVKDHYIASDKRVNLVVGDNGEYKTGSSVCKGLRMITFLDPESIKLNINPDVFPDVSDVNVTTFVGVYPEAEQGHTNAYRKLMSLEDAPVVSLVDHNKVTSGSLYRNEKDDAACHYHRVLMKKLINPVIDESEDKCCIMEQKGSYIKYYGRPLRDEEGNGQAFMIDPQVFFPFNPDKQIVYDSQMPDFVVCVYVTFKSGGRNYSFSKRFLPVYKAISGDEVKKKSEEIKAYSNKCKEGKAINKLNTHPSVNVYHPQGDERVQKTITIFDNIL